MKITNTWKSIWLLLLLFSTLFVACDDKNAPTNVPANENEGDNKVVIIKDNRPSTPKVSKIFYVVNEGWFGHDNGSINYFKKQDDGSYFQGLHFFRRINKSLLKPNEQLGKTTQFGTHWGKNLYLVSKQGHRLVVADQNSGKRVAVIDDLGGANFDGRAFVGVNEDRGYVSHSQGIAILDLKEHKIIGQVKGINAQVGNMVYSNGRLFAPVQGKGFFIISVASNNVEKTINGDFKTALAQSKDGTIWGANKEGLVAINPETLAHEAVKFSEATKIADNWGAWNRTPFVASTQENALYWAYNSKTQIYKYDIDKKSGKVHITLPNSPDDVAVMLYGGGIAINPVTDELIATVTSSDYTRNWNYIFDKSGALIKADEYKGDDGKAAAPKGKKPTQWHGGYYWFPAMPLIPDVNQPEILVNQILVKKGETITTDLAEMVIDHDNIPAQVTITVEPFKTDLFTCTLEGKKLTIKAGTKPGKAELTLKAHANGKTTTANVEILLIN